MESSDWIALASAVVALSALFISIWQGLVTRRHARLSAKPIIEIEFNSHTDAGMRMYNCGLGPATITRMVATIRNESYDLCGQVDHKPLIELLISDEVARALVHIYIVQPKSTVGVGQSIALIKLVGGAQTQELSNHLARMFREITVGISYESIYGEKFEVSHSGAATV